MTTSEIITSVNRVRVKVGAPALTENQLLDSAAAAKAHALCDEGYWSHNSPTGTDWSVFVTDSGYKYATAGENMLYGSPDMTSDNAVQSWVNSPGHYANMIQKNYTDTGVGSTVCQNYTFDEYNHGTRLIVVQEFAKPSTITVQQTVQPTSQSQATAASWPDPIFLVGVIMFCLAAGFILGKVLRRK